MVHLLVLQATNVIHRPPPKELLQMRLFKTEKVQQRYILKILWKGNVITKERKDLRRRPGCRGRPEQTTEAFLGFELTPASLLTFM